MESSPDVAIRRATLLERLDALATDQGSGHAPPGKASSCT